MTRLPVLAAALLLALAPAARAASLATTQRSLARAMSHAGLFAGAYVVDMGTGEELYSDRPDTTRMPASVEKLYTSATALLLYGQNGRLSTTVLSPELPDGDGDLAGDL